MKSKLATESGKAKSIAKKSSTGKHELKATRGHVPKMKNPSRQPTDNTASSLDKILVGVVKQLHKTTEEQFIERYKNKSPEELLKMFKIEMDAKNKAYYFILENGLFDRFKEYCYR